MKVLDLRKALSGLGGKTFYDRRVYAGLAPFFLINSVLVSNHAPTFTNWATLGLINVGALGICFLYFELAIRTIFKNKDQAPIRFVAIILFGFTVGAVKVLGTASLAYAVGFEKDLVIAIESRIYQTTFLGALVVVGVSAISLAQSRYQAERDLLIAERIQQQIANADNTNLDPDYEKALREFVASAKKQIKTVVSAPGDMIREIVEVSLRPLSHKLWERENARYLNFHWAELAQFSILQNKLAPTATSIIYLIITMPLAFYYSGIADAIGRSLLGAICIYIVLLAAKTLRFKNLTSAAISFVLVSLATAALVVWASTMLFGFLEGFDAINLGLAIFIMILQVNLLAGIIEVMSDNHKAIRKDLTTLIKSQGVDREVMLTKNLMHNRELANYLHGDVQNKLLSSAVRIEQSGNNPEVLIAELEQVERLLDDVNKSRLPAPSDTLNIQIANLVDSWRGFMMIQLSAGFPESTGSQHKDNTIAQIISEAISNSVRHGLAKNIVVSLNQAGPRWLLEITDDGLGPRSQPPGLGSKFFDSVSGSNWSLQSAKDGGSVLKISL